MSTYVIAEEALLTAVQALDSGATLTNVNSSRGDFTVLDKAGVTTAAVLVQAGKSEYADNLGGGRGTHGKRQQRHQIAVVLFQARGQVDDGTSVQALHTMNDGLITYLDKYPRLGSALTAIKRAEVVETDVPRIRQSSAWIFQAILVEILTETTPNLQEGPH